MESRLKERLTGAAILVALIVLLVPEMFRGQRSEETAPASSGEGPPLRSYTIDLTNDPSSRQPLQPTAPATAHDAGQAAPAAASSAPSTPAPAVTQGPHPMPLEPAAPAAPAPATAAAGTAHASPPPPAPTAHPAAKPAAASPMPAPAHAAPGGWSVQLGLFAQRDNAERLARSAQAKGFEATLTDRDARSLYHVQIGHLRDRAAAVALQSRLREQGFPAAVVAPR